MTPIPQYFHIVISSSRYLFVYGLPFFFGAAATCCIGHLIELNKFRKVNNRLRENNRLRDQFFADISHELRTPLSLILAPTQQILKEVESGAVDEKTELTALKTIENNAFRLSRLIDKLLEMTKIRLGQHEIHREPVDLKRLTENIFSDFEPLLKKRKLKARLAISLENPLVMMDRYAYERILFNLLTNAVKFTGASGTVDITLKSLRNGFVRLSVQDTGIGIASENIAKLFHPFKRVNTGVEGTGLGLAIIAGLVEALDGTINVNSDLGRGTEFVVEIRAPATRIAKGMDKDEKTNIIVPIQTFDDTTTDTEPSGSKYAGNKSRDYKKLLVVEDNAELAKFLIDSLNGEFDVRLAGDGEQALREIDSWEPALIISDLMMPNLDGLELCRLIRSRPTNADIPILLLTGFTDRLLIEQAWEAGMSDYLLKPLHLSELKGRVRSLLNTASLKQELQQEKKNSAVEESGRVLAEKNIEHLEEVQIELRRMNQVKDEFLATVSHELRTPMNVILGWAELLKMNEVLPEELHVAYEIVHRNARHQSKLIEDLLDISRIMSGKMELSLSPINLKTFMMSSINSVRLAADAKQIEIKLNILDQNGSAIENGSGDFPTTPVDPERMRQVIWNLLSNAIKFTSKQGTITVSICQAPSFVEVTILDNGEGIEPEFLPHVFERFLQEDSSKTRRFGGLGLGLSIARHIVELHGGSLTAYSAGKGKGSKFTIRLPILAVWPTNEPGLDNTKNDLDKAGVQRVYQSLWGVRVMLVDDDPNARDLLTRVLRKAGADVFAFASGKEAVLSTQQIRPNVLICDVTNGRSPGTNNFVQQIRAQAENIPYIPAAALSAKIEFPIDTVSSDFEAHLVKPVSASDLVETIATLARTKTKIPNSRLAPI